MTGHKKFVFDASVVVAITFGGALILAFALAMIGAIFGIEGPAFMWVGIVILTVFVSVGSIFAVIQHRKLK